MAARPIQNALIAGACLLTMGTAACSKPVADPLQLERGVLTVSNRTGQDWTRVEIWLNRGYRVTVESIPANSRFQVPLNSFAGGFGQRFEPAHMQVTDLRLSATLPNGQPLALTKAFTASGLAGALGGKR